MEFLMLNILVTFILSGTNCANILVLEEVPSPSHHIWLRHLLLELAKHGHNITSLSADYESNNYQNLHYLHLDKIYSTFYNETEESKIDFIEMGLQFTFSHVLELIDFTVFGCNSAMNSIGWKQLLNYPDEFKFDLILHDFVGGVCQLTFLEKFKNPPIVSITAFNGIFHTAEFSGTILTPAITVPFFGKELPTSLTGRITNYLSQMVDYLVQVNYIPKLLDRLFENISIYDVLEKRQELNKLILLNYDPAIDFSEQFPSNVINVGGLQIEKNVKSLPEDLQNIMEFSNKGVILFSLGTNVRSDTLGDELIIQIIEAFRSIPEYTFLWKFESKHFPVELPKNVKIRQWLPQNDILAHPKTKLFISHCGLLSTQEATWHGVPMLGIPIFADQFMNIEKSVRSGVAERLFVKDITNITLKDKILTVLNTPSYLENMKIRSKNFRDQKESPLERAVWWIEWVLRNPNATHLRSPGLHMSFIQRQSIDVISFLTVSVILVLVIMVYILKKILYILTKNMFKKLLKSKSD